ncbi:MAG: fatty acid hydroxylase family protein [Bdellovibrionota bacterium]
MNFSVKKFRENWRSRQKSRFYSGWLHLGFTSAVSLTGIAAAVAQLESVAFIEFLVVPITFGYANFIEYKMHKGPLHRRTRFFGLLFQRHTLEHHHFFTAEHLQVEKVDDFKVVLFPAWLIVFFFGFFAIPVGYVFHQLLSANAGYLFAATSLGYFLNYEWLHLAYHIDERSWLARLPLLKGLRKHHQVHHDPRLMSRYHFNITYPICDWLFQTTLRTKRKVA